MVGPALGRGLPRRRLTGRPVAASALRRGPRAQQHRLLRTRRAPLRPFSGRTAALAGAHRPRPPPPGPRVQRGALRVAGGAAIRAQGAAWGQRAPRACPPLPPEPRGACARGGGAHVRVFVLEPDEWPRAGQSLSERVGDQDLPGDVNCQEGHSGPFSPLLLPPPPSFLRSPLTPGKGFQEK